MWIRDACRSTARLLFAEITAATCGLYTRLMYQPYGCSLILGLPAVCNPAPDPHGSSALGDERVHQVLHAAQWLLLLFLLVQIGSLVVAILVRGRCMQHSLSAHVPAQRAHVCTRPRGLRYMYTNPPGPCTVLLQVRFFLRPSAGNQANAIFNEGDAEAHAMSMHSLRTDVEGQHINTARSSKYAKVRQTHQRT